MIKQRLFGGCDTMFEGNMKKAVLLMGIIGVFCTFWGCSQETTKNTYDEYKKVETFYFSMSGSCPGYSYDIHPDTKNPDKMVMIIDDFERGIRNKKVKPGKDLMGSLAQICEEQNIVSWDKFDECSPDVLDGYGFSLYIRFEDGTEVRASGENAFPAGFREFEGAVSKILQ